VAIQGSASRPVCIECIDEEGPKVEYICSAIGCGKQPRILAVMEGEGTVSVLVCVGHFTEIRGSVISYIELPEWLTDGNTLLSGNGDVVFDIDLGPGGD
jgi:hypothetical protein